MILKCASLYWNGRITFLRQLAIVVTVRFRYQRYEHESSFVEVAAGVNFSCLCSYVSPRSYEHADVGVLKSVILCVTVTVAFRVHQISVMNSIILTLRLSHTTYVAIQVLQWPRHATTAENTKKPNQHRPTLRERR